MKRRSIDSWKSIFQQDSELWRSEVQQVLDACTNATGGAVISAAWAPPEGAARSRDTDPEAAPLAGLPYAVKDLFDVRGRPTHCSSRLPEFREAAATSDAGVVRYMAQLGASCVAKTQMNEFAYGLSGENPHYGDCPHPHLPECLSGGSSSGSAHLVGKGYLPLAFGTDTGGSIRLPAAWCGIYGVRWQPGYVSEGAFPLAPSFDAIGWFTQDAADMIAVLEAWFRQFPPARAAGKRGTRDVRGGWLCPEELLSPAALPFYREAIGGLDQEPAPLGAELSRRLPDCQRAFNILQSREAYALHAPRLAAQGELFDPAVRQRIERAKDWRSDEVEEAASVRDWVRAWFAAYFQTHDYLVMPICPGPAIPPQSATTELRENTLKLTTPASLGQYPALAIPFDMGEGRSIGLQFIFSETAPDVPLALLQSCAST